MKQNTSIAKILPVLFGFFIMGFVDVVGISTSYVQNDFMLSDTLANFLPMMVFMWFAVFSVPTGILMNHIGRKKTVLLSMVITTMALLIPVIHYDYLFIIVAFALIGIGNTILQVSLNPLVSNVVSGEKLTSFLTLGQFTKALASFLGPIIAGVAASFFGDWKLLFPVFASVTLLSSVWLVLVPIPEPRSSEKVSSFSGAFALLGNRTILLLFLGIVAIVGIDVGMNMITPKFLMERTSLSLEKAGLGTSLYFAARTVGTLMGAIFLAKISAIRFFKFSMILGLVFTGVLFFSHSPILIFALVGLIGLAVANIFSILFSLALHSNSERSNEISGLMIMGVAGGAVLPPIMGVLSDLMGQSGGLIVITAAMLYLFYISFVIKE